MMIHPLHLSRPCTSKLVAASKLSWRRRQRLDVIAVEKPIQHSRLFSATTTPKRSTESSSSKRGHDKDSLLQLYQRDGDRMRMPRAALGMSALNTTYWLWYSLDFIPAVNASPLHDLHIDPKLGWGALALGVVINGLTALYPSLLVSRLNYDPGQNQLLVYRHSFPLLSPSTQSTSYALGEVSIAHSDSNLKKILGDYKGDWRKYKGHLALKRKNHTIPLLMEIQNGREEVKDGEMLLQVLLRPKALSSTISERRKSNNAKSGTKGKRSRK